MRTRSKLMAFVCLSGCCQPVKALASPGVYLGGGDTAWLVGSLFKDVVSSSWCFKAPKRFLFMLNTMCTLLFLAVLIS